ncbi:TlpA family protein disulfide reductase [Paenibacillus sp. FSL W7-1287]|uniref:TlpA family protein disulfide reductase n=1 Tax=Paenibacillus sp. FSL W7-1287 TaxID=2954538 RepID=UPI0030F9B133
MTYLTLGQFSIPISWLAFLLAIIYSDFRNNNKDDTTNKILNRLLWSYLIVWKFSYILFAWSSFRLSPISLLYFDGGLKGHLLAILTMTILLVKTHRGFMWEVGWKYWARFIAVFQLISYSFSEHWLLALTSLILFIMIEWRWKLWILFAQWTILLWSAGWGDPFVIAHGMVLISLLIKQRNKHHITLVIILSLLATALTDIRTLTSTTERLPIDLMTTTNERYILSEQEQQLTIVNFFATWCPPCQAEMPHLQKFADNLPHGVELIGINLADRDHGPEALQAFMSKYNVTYPILLDERDDFGQAYRIKAIPTTVILNEEGQELERIIGPVSEQRLHELAKKYQ